LATSIIRWILSAVELDVSIPLFTFQILVSENAIYLLFITVLFEDPQPEAIERLISDMRERVNREEFHVQLNATEFEKEDLQLKRFLMKQKYDLEIALNEWHRWVQWRHGKNIIISYESVVKIICVF
jgi:hypothetical protein